MPPPLMLLSPEIYVRFQMSLQDPGSVPIWVNWTLGDCRACSLHLVSILKLYLFPVSRRPEFPSSASENEKPLFFFGRWQEGPSTPGRNGLNVSGLNTSGLFLLESLKPDSDAFCGTTKGCCSGSQPSRETLRAPPLARGRP